MIDINKILSKSNYIKDESIDIVSTLSNSLNGNIYNIKYKGNLALLKTYKSDEKERIIRESKCLEFLNKKNFDYVPQLINVDRSNKFIIISLLEGVKPKKDPYFILQLAEYINNMQMYFTHQDLQELPNAAESCFSIRQHSEIIINKLKSIIEKSRFYPKTKKIIRLLESKILPWIYSYDSYLRSNIESYNIPISNNEKILSQSDIGIHNSLIYNKDIYTFDYEYAGLDDPAKTFCDLIIHPELNIDNQDLLYFLDEIRKIKIFKNSYNRFQYLIPLYRYKWFGIIINNYFKKIIFKDKSAELSLEKAFGYLKNTYSNIQTIQLNMPIPY